MKTCHLCSTPKPETDFYKVSGRRGLMKACKACHNARSTRWGQANADKRRESVRASHRKQSLADPARYRGYVAASYNNRRQFIEAEKNVPCLDCKARFPPECMDFDHVRGDKKFNVSARWSCGFTALIDEISKCEIVCANCHRIRTRKRAKEQRTDADSD